MVGRGVLLLGSPLWSGLLCPFCAPCLHWTCCAGAGPASLVGCAVLVLGPPPWWGVLWWCLAGLHGGVCVLVLGLPPWPGARCCCVARLHARASCAGAWPAPVVGCAVLVCGPPLRPGLLCRCCALLRGWLCRAGAWQASMVGCAVAVCYLPFWLGDADAVATFIKLQSVSSTKKQFGVPCPRASATCTIRQSFPAPMFARS